MRQKVQLGSSLTRSYSRSPLPPLRRAISLLATTALLGACAGAQAPPPSDGKPGPFLYRIDGAVPSHLFGTIHLPDERVLELPSSVQRALDDADAVYTEVKMDDETRAELARLVAEAGGRAPLRERLPADLYARVERYLAQRRLPIAMFESQPVWSIGLTLALLDYLPELQAGRPMLDQALVWRAEWNGAELGGLELPAEQVAVFESIDDAGQAQMLRDTLDQLEAPTEDGRGPIDLLIAAYLAGDEAQLLAAVRESVDPADASGTALFDRLLDRRSDHMAERIEALVSANPERRYFFAIGAAHLPGTRGVVSLLRTRGLRIERVGR